MLWDNPSVCCEYALLSLVNKELTGLQLGRKRLCNKAPLGGCWEEGRQSLKLPTMCREKQDGHAVLRKRNQALWQSVDKKYGLI